MLLKELSHLFVMALFYTDFLRLENDDRHSLSSYCLERDLNYASSTSE